MESEKCFYNRLIYLRYFYHSIYLHVPTFQIFYVSNFIPRLLKEFMIYEVRGE